MNPYSQYSSNTLDTFMKSLVPGILVLGTPTCLIASDETFFAVNQAYLDITGRQAHEVTGLRVQDIV